MCRVCVMWMYTRSRFMLWSGVEHVGTYPHSADSLSSSLTLSQWYEVLKHAPVTADYFADPLLTAATLLVRHGVRQGVVERAEPGQFIRARTVSRNQMYVQDLYNGLWIKRSALTKVADPDNIKTRVIRWATSNTSTVMADAFTVSGKGGEAMLKEDKAQGKVPLILGAVKNTHKTEPWQCCLCMAKTHGGRRKSIISSLPLIDYAPGHHVNKW